MIFFWIQYLIPESWIHYLLTRVQLKLTFLFWSHYEITSNRSRNNFEFEILFQFTYCYTNALSIHNFSCEFTIIARSVTRFHHHLTICFANSLSIHHIFHELTFNSLLCSRIYYRFRKLTITSLSVSRIHYQFTILYTNSLSVSRMHYQFTILYTNALSIWWIDDEFAKQTLNW